ncbi:hypothetical protein J6590_089495 [Homalodisca vitripennis]|nr:hypothetical protein J6590_089495 [Homalodisca vitripennis]
MTENFVKDDTVVIIAGANLLESSRRRSKEVYYDTRSYNLCSGVEFSSPSRFLDLLQQQESEGNQHRAAGECRGGKSRNGGRVIIVGETFIHPTRDSQPDGEVGAFRHDSCGCAEASSARSSTPNDCRWSAVGALASRISSSAKSQMHERLRRPSPTNCLQHESYAGAVRSTAPYWTEVACCGWCSCGCAWRVVCLWSLCSILTRLHLLLPVSTPIPLHWDFIRCRQHIPNHSKVGETFINLKNYF